MELLDRHQFNTGEEFKTIMDPLPIMVRACDKDGMVCYSNVAWKQFTGDLPLWSSGIHKNFRLAYEELFASHIELRIAFKTKYRFCANGGAYCWLAEQSIPWYSTEGSYLGYICYMMDIDELIANDVEQVSLEALQREQSPPQFCFTLSSILIYLIINISVFKVSTIPSGKYLLQI
jgi:hypothetical protein